MVLKLAAHHLQTILTHAQSTYPEECCGLLLGSIDATDKTVVDVKPTENTWNADMVSEANLNKTRRYGIEPAAMLAAMREARDRTLSIIGIYHSHPNSPAVPSECDRQLAWQQYSYVIVSVQAQAISQEPGFALDWRSWSLDDQHQFQPEEISILSPAAMHSLYPQRMNKGNE